MSSYSNSQLKDAMLELIEEDEEIRQAIREALEEKQRHWIFDIVSDVAKMLFGAVAERVVGMVADWIFREGLDLLSEYW